MDWIDEAYMEWLLAMDADADMLSRDTRGFSDAEQEYQKKVEAVKKERADRDELEKARQESVSFALSSATKKAGG